VTTSPQLRKRAGERFDVILVALLVLGCEAEVVAAVARDHGHDHWPLAANVLIAAGLTLPLAWRRSAPLASLVVVESSLFLLAAFSLADVAVVNIPQLVLLVAPYSVAAYAPRTRAFQGLAYAALMAAAVNLVHPSGATSWVFSLGACVAAWTTGRIIQAHRASTAELRRTSDRLAAESGARELLAIAEQRTRIARELHALIAESVSTMIVQTRTAQRLLEQRSDEADAAMETIESTGRQALVEMRRVLGVLRQPDERAVVTPQPGVGQIPALIERARATGLQLALHVEGDPGPLPASVDVGLYRLLEEALRDLPDLGAPIDILLRFASDDIELGITFGAVARLDLPTIAMRERVALCQGTIDVDVVPQAGERLAIRLPRVFDGVPA
jgi:signal transduction histidine kinase